MPRLKLKPRPNHGISCLIFITISTIKVVPRIGISASGGVGFGYGIEKIGRLRAQFKAPGKW